MHSRGNETSQSFVESPDKYNDNDKAAWDDLQFADKAKLFNYWSIVMVLGNLF